jgi:hypothetical protein
VIAAVEDEFMPGHDGSYVVAGTRLRHSVLQLAGPRWTLAKDLRRIQAAARIL